jgi:hypothetical protein
VARDRKNMAEEKNGQRCGGREEKRTAILDKSIKWHTCGEDEEEQLVKIICMQPQE